MDGLPVGWESDYDGSRWLYRFTPTGHTQFGFPKPGDEFPQFDTPGAGPIAFTSDERLMYEQQLKLRGAGLSTSESPATGKGKAGTKNDNFGTKSTSGYFDPSGFMYLGEGEDDVEDYSDTAPTW